MNHYTQRLQWLTERVGKTVYRKRAELEPGENNYRAVKIRDKEHALHLCDSENTDMVIKYFETKQEVK